MSKLISGEKELKEVIKDTTKALVLFYVSWCPFCAMFLPVFEKHAGDGYRVITDDLPETEDEFSIDVVPTVLCFRNGKVVRRLDGEAGVGLSEDQLKEMLAACGQK